MGNDKSGRKPLTAPPAKGKVDSKLPPGKPAAKPAAPAVVAKTKVPSGIFADPVLVDTIANEEAEKARHKTLTVFVKTEAILVAVLSFVLIFSLPFVQEPVYRYFVKNQDRVLAELVGLPVPNMTNHAVLAWGASSITEVMTIGFGDFEDKLLKQKWRFTSDGWDAFVHAFLDQKIGDTFRQSQLVLTTVPSDTPVIVYQGESAKHVYEWHVQMPVVMTYATNNNVTRKEKAVITLTIVRSSESPVGIAIHSWSLG